MTTPRRYPGLATAITLLLTLTACSSASDHSEEENPYYSAALPSVILPELGINGRVVTAVDDLGHPPMPSENGWIVAIPADKAPDWDDLPEDWSQTRLETAEALLATVDDQARFHLTTEPGQHLICDTWQHPETKTYELSKYSCDEIYLPETGTVTAIRGDGMFGAFVDDPSHYTN
ncbi:hypothetical protein SAMN06309944_0762 [Micrococcales bacterium KH10]|nr:hypothetical protein SAMN06309944_0762 [Micrococcales bacterium KH10]